MSFCASCSGAIQEFIRSSFCGIEKILAAYNRWWGNRNLASAFMVISYEQMSKDLGLLLRDSLRFMGNWPIDEIPISESVLAASLKICATSRAKV
jgi:hypothetical protein